jgi:dTDP-4-dehydrorhamnose reductase
VKLGVLGSSGMLGRAVVRTFKARGVDVSELPLELPSEPGRELNSTISELETLLGGGFDYVINCIGRVNRRITSGSYDSALAATIANIWLPSQLTSACQKHGIKLLSPATDCVFDGESGNYFENSRMTPIDLYGLSKALGEAGSQGGMYVRASFIGRESGRGKMLLEWVLSHSRGARIQGFTNHFWNGVTAIALSRVFYGIIQSDLFRSGTFHLIPADYMTKDELVRVIAKAGNRDDLLFESVQADSRVDRTLNTLWPEFNAQLWKAAGYSELPSIQTLIHELSLDFDQKP